MVVVAFVAVVAVVLLFWTWCGWPKKINLDASRTLDDSDVENAHVRLTASGSVERVKVRDGLITENCLAATDRRHKVNPPYPSGQVYRAIGQIVADFDDGYQYIGTGAIVKLSGSGKEFILTAAHNFYSVDETTGKGSWALRATFWKARHETGYASKHAVTNWSFLPGYGYHDHKHGCDLAIAAFDKSPQTGYVSDAFLVVDPEASCCSGDKCPQGPWKSVTLSGYPGEKKQPCSQYAMSGELDAKYDKVVKWDPLSFWPYRYAVSVYSSIDTTGGQSGSPLVANTKSGRLVVGVHVCGSSSYNTATRITPDVIWWMKRAAKKLQ